ncbi:2ab2568c-04d2-425a-a7e4-b0fd733b6101 [Thermothielavioides terrestris]|uniref:2ab2568c-04d2-425a-a7e4-b0fd733b6101 n=1 Tax=Thermothielavioides terrestris TaxID=2587410 RepID=A0A3S4F4J6_9PEZI|nr:2ab2568c-04d2-425a-a7e4-b0fd733b6101 [Thermothielavioides terrestris]
MESIKEETVRSQLPDLSLAEFDFLDSSFFRDAGRKLPSPEEVLKATGKEMGDDGVYHIREIDQFIGSLHRGPVQDIYFSPDQHRGPFATAREFHDFVQLVSAAAIPVEKRLPEPYRDMLPDTARICLTHGDLHLGNILVARSPEDNRISLSGIVDWAQAGWYPEYWEYCKAMIVGPYGDEWRDDGWINIVLRPWEDEYEAFDFYWHSRCP